jgi:tripartite ATP-independent transporter DctM subunit
MSLFAMIAFHFAQVDSAAIAIEIYRLAAAPTLLTIPLFTFAGYVMAKSESPKRLLNLARASLGWMPGGVAIVSLVVCAFFTAFTGASGVTIIALGGLLLPVLLEQGYSEKFALGLITTAGSLGLLFPPSLPIILYGIVAKVNIDDLFLAGIIPGTLLIVALSIFSMVQKKVPTAKPSEKFNFKTLRSAIYDSRYELPLPFFVLGGIYGGFITVTEASAMCALYVVVVQCFLYKDVSFTKEIPKVITESMSLVGAILLILCCALGVTNYLVDEEIPLQILEAMGDVISNKLLFLLCLNVFLLIIGSMMDIFSAIIVVVPLILPIAGEFGVNPIHLAIIFLTNLEIGYITPPVGINLFISSFRFKKSVTSVYASAIPFVILLTVVLLIITYIPWLTLLWF